MGDSMTAPAPASRPETRVELGTLLAGLGGVLLLISLFLDWYGPEEGEGGATAWESFELVDLLLAALALAALYVVARRFSGPDGWPTISEPTARALGVAALVLVVVSLIDHPPLLQAAGGDVEPEVGLWLALAGALLMTLGGFLGRVRISVVTAAPEPTARPRTPPHDPDAETRTLR